MTVRQAGDFAEIRPPPDIDLIEALRESVVENVKFFFAENSTIRFMDSRRRRRHRFAGGMMGWQFRLIDVDNGVKCIKEQRGIIHGSHC